MKIYNVIWEDRHTDTEVYNFSDKDKAIEWARNKAREEARFNDDEIDETRNDAMIRGGWLYYGRYSCEGDHIVVVEKELDSEV